MDALTQANVRLIRRVSALEQRLAALELRLGLHPPAPPEPEPQPLPVPLPIEISAPPPRRSVETGFGLTWINRIAVFTCILAVAFFFKYAVDNDWIGPAARILLGILASLIAIAAADILRRRGHDTYAQGICGLGVSILYLSFFAAFSFYRLIPQNAAFGLMVLTTICAVALSLRYQSQALAILALMGGYATPPLLSTGQLRPVFIFNYLGLLNAAAIVLSRRISWPLLDPFAFLATVVLYIATTEKIPPADPLLLTAGIYALLYYALFAAARPLVFLGAHFFAAFALAALWQHHVPHFFLAQLALAAAGLLLCARRNLPRAMMIPFAALALSCLFFTESINADPHVWLLLSFLCAAFLLFLAASAWKPNLYLIALNPVWFFAELTQHFPAQWHGLASLVVAALHFALAWFFRRLPIEDRRPFLLAAGLGIAFFTLAIPIQLAGFYITIAWAIEAAALAWIAARTRSVPLAAITGVVLSSVLVRLLLEDAPLYSWHDSFAILFNARFFTFLVSAFSFWAAARFLSSPTPILRIQPLVTYLLGHLVLLSALILDVTAWVHRSVSIENFGNAAGAAISVLCALYAVVLAAVGIATRTLVNRISGLALIAFVVLKLYLYDVWQLRLLYRIAAFAILGGLLLAMSFLYSRYRASQGRS
jgi:uncharacterized membrane protein